MIEQEAYSSDIAIIGMSGRFPGARNLEEFWDLLSQGREAVSRLTDQQLQAEGVTPTAYTAPNYVRMGAVLDDIELFDASFFDISPRDAALMDPQHRFFLECAWETLEGAGYDTRRSDARIGVFAGASMNTYLLANLSSDRELLEREGNFLIGLGNEKDYLATRTSYKLNLNGPSISIGTACSTSLVAVHLAVQSLQCHECDMALAGGAAIRVPHRTGYFYQEGGIASPDGHCRSFDAQAQGTIRGNGVGVVLLKRLDDAVADGDLILAVIKGTAINNDGAAKVGYTAPGIKGQADVISEAQAMAGIEPEMVSYVEAHGTATQMGDPIEVTALTQAFLRNGCSQQQYCALGSVKSNIGHLDAAAGIAGLIKVVLALQHKLLPPSLHFTAPNPAISFEQSPFYVNTRLQSWERHEHPRTAGISSFGIGGTNAHVIVQEAPRPKEARQVTSRKPWYLLPLSAKTETALERTSSNLATHLANASTASAAIADIAATLQLGRRQFAHRQVVLCQAHEDALSVLKRADPKYILNGVARSDASGIAFLFPGQGSQHVRMAADVYRYETVFREQLDRCAAYALPELQQDVRALIYPDEQQMAEAAERLKQTAIAQPVLFMIEYALAQQWMAWGLKPSCMLGHSIGEYVAACLAGVFSLEDALRLTIIRGRLIQQLPTGSMLTVPLPPDVLQERLKEHPLLSLAAINTPRRCVVSGPTPAIEQFSAQLKQHAIEGRMLHTSHAFHSRMMEPIVAAFTEQVRKVTRRKVAIPYISNLTGTWITNEEAKDPSYWGRHLVQTVRFAEGVQTLLSRPAQFVLEVGPGTVLSSLIKQSSVAREGQTILASLPHPKERESDLAVLLRAAGQCWLQGAALDWSGFVEPGWQKVALPTYPFERTRHWIAPVRPTASTPPIKASNGHQSISSHTLHEEHTHMSIHSPSITDTPPVSQRLASITEQLRTIFSELLGADLSTLETSQSFLEVGADSLLLLQVSQKLQERFGVKIPFRLLLEEYDTFDALALYLDQLLPAPALPSRPETPPAPPAIQPPALQPASNGHHPAINGRYSAPSMDTGPGEVRPERVKTAPSQAYLPESRPLPGSQNEIMQIFGQQIEILSQQLDILRRSDLSPQVLPAPAPQTPTSTPYQQSTTAPSRPSVTPPEAVITSPEREQSTDETRNVVSMQVDPETFVAYKPRNVGRLRGLTEQQQEHLHRLIERFAARTRRSKQIAQQTRLHHADNRGTAGFNLTFKEIVYPLAVERAQGSHIVDVDGNEYVDITMGFGALLYGHSPDFIVNAIQEHISKGIRLGMLSPSAGEAAQLLCELTGAERASFCNSGTEAVMTALRLARAVTGRDKIVLFSGSFHGTFDGVLVRGRDGGQASSKPIPLAPGITPNLIGDVLLLQFGSPQAVETIRQHAHELAAILVELPQSRRPDLQPTQFLRQLREIADQAEIALIFDEVVAGFRTHPGGAQALFGVRADIVTYGKALGGGLPVSALAGKAKYLDAVDGGMWNYGDASYPDHLQTFFAGTYFKHPLTMPAVCAILKHLKQSGPQLQEELNKRTDYLVQQIEQCFKEAHLPVQPVHFCSLFRLVFPPHYKNIDANVFYYHLLERGVYISETRNGFLSTAHTNADIEYIIQAVREALRETQAGGFLKVPAASVATSASM